MAQDPTSELIEQAARNFQAKARRTMTDHPEVEVLLAYQEGRLLGEEADRVRRHLVLCQDCAREVLSLGAFDEPATEGFPTEAENLASWERFQRKLADEAAGKVPATEHAAGRDGAHGGGARDGATGSRSRRRPRPWRLGNPWLLAASIAFAVTGLATWWPTFQMQMGGLAVLPGAEAPHLLPFRLRPAGESAKRSASVVENIGVPAATDTLISTLLIADQDPFPEYRVEIQDQAGRPVVRHRGVRRQKDGSFLLQLPRSKLPDGVYRLHLSGIDGEREETLAVYDFALHTE